MFVKSTVFSRYESNICVWSLIKVIVLNIRIKVSRHNIHMEHIQLTPWICFSRGDIDLTLILWVMVLNNKPMGLNINNQELLMALLSDRTNARRSQTSQFLTNSEDILWVTTFRHFPRLMVPLTAGLFRSYHLLSRLADITWDAQRCDKRGYCVHQLHYQKAQYTINRKRCLNYIICVV